MGKAAAILMLVVVVLWAAAPAFACLAPSQPHACCRHMDMPDCDMSTMGAAASCCQVSTPDTSGAPAIRAITPRTLEIAHPTTSILLAPEIRPGSRPVSIAETPPPHALTGSSVLRI